MKRQFSLKSIALLLFLMIFKTAAGQISSEQDSIFWSLSLPEIQGYKAYYMQELERLYEEKRMLIQSGIADGERLLETNPDYEVKDEILIRLADLYYYQAKEAFFEQLDAYDAAIDQYDAGQLAVMPEEPRYDFSRPLTVYQQIIDEFPQSDLIDDAIYNKAFLYEELRENEKANQIYFHLIDAYPNSIYVAEAYTRLAESYFNPPVNDLETAISYYKKVLNYKQSPRYVEALYKLGWSYYRLSEYPQAVSYFTSLIEDFNISGKYDSDQLEKRSDLRQEAIDYIAISFIDFGGPENANDYLGRIGYPDWAFDVLEKLGTVYMKEKEEYPLAIEAFGLLLAQNPYAVNAPEIQQYIVECHRLQENDAGLFAARNQLFQQYHTETLWWEKTDDEKAKLRGYRLAENALRENINSLIQKAKDQQSPSLYEKAVDLGKNYLKTFPEDVYAYMIRWNIALILDVQLHKYKEALHEYLTISLVYNSSEYKEFAREKGLNSLRDAAENAIVVADSLVRIEKRDLTAMNDQSNVLDQQQALPFGKREKTELTAAENWLSMSYDNYIKLFPFDDRTPSILTNAGALFYTHNQFPEALKYFKTLVKYFPKSEEVHNAHFAILESYFGRKDYESAEMIAKTIMDANVPARLKDKAEKRMGESIFLKAQAMAEAGKSAEAAREFYRMALEAPTLAFADRALFNAAREFEKISDYASAVRAYELLRNSYTGSEFMADVLNNVAFDYGEIGDYLKGGARYEILHAYLKEGEKAESALYNAWVFYANGSHWPEAIRAGNQYVQLYPNAPYTMHVFYRGAEFALSMADTAQACTIYQQFAAAYQDSALCVDAFYQQGKLFHQQHKIDQAILAYQQAFDANNKLKQKSLPRHDFIACEALYQNAGLIHDRYMMITFEELPQAGLAAEKKRKESLLENLVDKYQTIAAFGTHRMPETVYLIGQAYEHYARHWAGQALTEKDAVQRAVKQKEINAMATLVYGQAYSAFQQAIVVMDKILQTAASEGAGPDSVQISTRKWQDQAKEKVSETLYHIAELNDQSIQHILEVPVPEELKYIARFEYKSQILLKAVQPLIQVVVAAHKRNLSVADSLGIVNQWTEASSNKIKETLALMGEQYRMLSLEALTEYDAQMALYEKRTFNEKKSASDETIDLLADLIDIAKTFGDASIQFYGDGIARGESSGLMLGDRQQLQDYMLSGVLQIADKMDAAYQHALRQQAVADRAYNETDNVIFEDALVLFEDHDYFLYESITALLERAVQTESQFDLSSKNSGWLKIRLVQFNPENYSERLGVPVYDVTIQTDTTWLFTASEAGEWREILADTVTWTTAQRSLDSLETDSESVLISGLVNQNFRKPVPVYFKKNFIIAGLPIRGQIETLQERAEQVIVNQSLVLLNEDNREKDILTYLKKGKNCLMVAVDAKSPIYRGAVTVRYIPESALPRMEFTVYE